MDYNKFLDKVRDRAYYKYLHRKYNNLPGNPVIDWIDAEREEIIEEKIREEAFMHYLGHGDDPIGNYISAKQEIEDRLKFLAFYMHERNIGKTPIENWVEAQKLYVDKF